MFKRTIWLVVLVIGMAGVVFAEEAKKDISVTLSSKVYSEYLSSNSGGICHDGPVIQTDMFISLPRGFYFDVWHSAGLNGTDLSSDYGDEIDYTIGWSGKVKGIGLDLGVAYFDLIDLFEAPHGDLIMPYLEFNKGFDISKNHRLTPFVCFKFPYSAKGDELGHGFRTYLGTKHAWQINPKLSFNQKINLLFDDGACGNDSGVLGQYQGGISWQASKQLTLDLISVKAVTPLTSLSDSRETKIVYGAGITYRF